MPRDTDDDDILQTRDGPDDAGTPPTGAETRAMLRNVAAYRTLVGHVRGSAWSSLGFGALMLVLWYSLPGKAQFDAFGLSYLGLGVLEFTVGLVNLIAPTLEGILFDGVVLIVFGVLSGLRNTVLGPPSPFVLLSVYWIYSGFQRSRNYFQIRRAFPVRPSSANLRWFKDLIRDVRAADPASDPTALDLPSKPPVRVKLLGDSAFLIASGSDDLIILPADMLYLDKIPAEGGPAMGTLLLDGVSPKPFPIDDDNWRNYTEWKRANGL